MIEWITGHLWLVTVVAIVELARILYLNFK